MQQENTSKVLLIRREYWTYALLNMLGVNKLVNYFSGWMPSTERIASFNKAKIEDYLIDKLFCYDAVLFSPLTGTDIIALSKKK